MTNCESLDNVNAMLAESEKDESNTQARKAAMSLITDIDMSEELKIHD